jgi:hypothetical protein
MGALCIPYFTLLENKMYQKVQREKLYNFQSKVYFDRVFVFKQSKVLCEHFLQRRNLIARNFVDFEQKNRNCKISGLM